MIRAHPGPLRIGTAGWTLPKAVQHRFPEAGSHLERYARVFAAAEIDSTFYRAHRPATYARWAASVPPGFAFSVKMPKAITHEHRLVGVEALLDGFLADLAPLGARVHCLLVQLPPSFAFGPAVVPFLAALRARYAGGVALEPRHPTWFDPAIEAALESYRVGRVAADPPCVPTAAVPGGWPGLAYWRLHGSPRTYFSPYGPAALDALARAIAEAQDRGSEAWCIFDNTASGAAAANALDLLGRCD